MDKLSRLQILAMMVVLTVIFGAWAYVRESNLVEDLPRELFYIGLSSIVVIFVLESILERDIERRKRRADKAYFRTVVAYLMAILYEIVSTENADTILAAAVKDETAFAGAMEAAASDISKLPDIRSSAYYKYYIEVSSILRDIAVNFTRLYSRDEGEMTSTFLDLHRLASDWVYHDTLTPHFDRDYEKMSDEEAKRELAEERQRQTEIVERLTKQSANRLADLSARAVGPGLPPA